MTLKFSTFYASVPSEDDALCVHPHARTSHDESIAMIDMLFRSAAHFNPGSRYAILTSPATDLSAIAIPFERVDIDVRRDTLMLDRMRGQRQQVRDLRPDETLVLLDTDILVQADLSHLEAIDFDVAATWRAASLPINGGLLMARNREGGRSLKFFDDLLTVFQQEFFAEQQWNGDQLALRSMLPNLKNWDRTQAAPSYESAQVAILHSDLYNYSPPDNLDSFLDPRLRDRFIVHFKGHRKRFMASYFHRLLMAGR